MSKQWIPEWAKSYVITQTDRDCLEIEFYDIGFCDVHQSTAKPVSELHQEFIDDVCQQIKNKPLEARMMAHNKYSREIKPNVWVDVYDTLAAFTGDVSSRIKPAVDHAIKKLLAPGKRGVKDERQDLVEARDSLDRAISQLDEWA